MQLREHHYLLTTFLEGTVDYLKALKHLKALVIQKLGFSGGCASLPLPHPLLKVQHFLWSIGLKDAKLLALRGPRGTGVESTPKGGGSQQRGGGTGWTAQATVGSCLGRERRNGRQAWG